MEQHFEAIIPFENNKHQQAERCISHKDTQSLLCCHPTRTQAVRASNQSTLGRPCYVMTTWSSSSRSSRVLEPAARREGPQGQSEFKGTFHTFKEGISGMRPDGGVNPKAANPYAGLIVCWNLALFSWGIKWHLHFFNPFLTLRISGIPLKMCLLEKKSFLVKVGPG